MCDEGDRREYIGVNTLSWCSGLVKVGVGVGGVSGKVVIFKDGGRKCSSLWFGFA